jgi:uncharacterized repeat protein (TIGR01451 family)
VTNAAAATVGTGFDLTYTITAGNNGPDAATKVVVTDAVPAGSTFVSVLTSAGTCTSPSVGGTGTVRCTIGNLAVSATATVTLTVKVEAAAGKEVTDTAHISAGLPQNLRSPRFVHSSMSSLPILLLCSRRTQNHWNS